MALATYFLHNGNEIGHRIEIVDDREHSEKLLLKVSSVVSGELLVEMVIPVSEKDLHTLSEMMHDIYRNLSNEQINVIKYE